MRRLVVLSEPQAGAVFDLREGDNLIGRCDPEGGTFPEIDLEPHDVDAKVSRRHAVLSVTGETAILEDMGSLNGTYLGMGQRVEPGAKIPLVHGAEIVIGKTRLRLE
jgi:pSer/pThr/pTyr-binding forkhead associated (FHA) protein